MDCLYADEKNNMNRGGMFSNCQELLFVDISKIRKNLFYNDFYCCKKLKYVFLPKSDFWIFGFSFYNCDNLKLVINIKNCSNYSKNNNFNTSEKLLFFMATKEQSEDKNELKCKYFDSSDKFYEKFYPTKNPLPKILGVNIITTSFIMNGSTSFLLYAASKKLLVSFA